MLTWKIEAVIKFVTEIILDLKFWS